MHRDVFDSGAWGNGMFYVIMGVAGVFLFAAGYFYGSHLADKRIYRYQNDLIEKHCEEVENMYRQTRGWRHDYHNHIQTMKAYLAMNRLSELEEYFNELDRDLLEVDTVLKSGNVKVDAVLNSKLSLAKSRGIKIHAKAKVPENLRISEVDVSLVIGNLMDNAMEACMKVEDAQKRFIRVYLDVLKGQLYIYVMNSVGGRLKKEGSRYLSTKRGAGHGFGLMRLDRVVQKYQGYLHCEDETDVFVAEVMLPL